MLFEVHEHLPLTRSRAALRRIPELLSSGCFVILDLEDSAMCVFDEAETFRLKNEARAGLRRVAARIERSSALDRVQIRINEIGSPHYEEDIIALADWAKAGLPLHLSVPKIDSPDMARQCRDDVLRVCGAEPSLSPIFEVGAALGRIREIAQACPGNRRRAFWGYYDYALDTGIWPFDDQRSEAFWDLARQFAEEMEAAGMRYVHTPPPVVADRNELRAVKAMAMSICRRPAGISTLGRAQTNALCEPVDPRPMELVQSPWTREEAIARANETVALFEANATIKRSFAVIGDRFIPPHEYLAAKAFLEANVHPKPSAP